MEGNTQKEEWNGCRQTHQRETFEIRRHCGEQLLPGIPNDITLDLITPKLPWSALHTLSSVSRGWREAIQTNQVYEARVRANSTETLIVHPHIHDKRDAIALYSTSQKCCYELPPIPSLPRGILNSCECIALDGKVYVLGGHRILGGDDVLRGGPAVRSIASVKGLVSSGEVYVLDLAAGQREWKQCASMLEARSGFGCGVMNGKIYVFGGTDTEGKRTLGSTELLLGSEVYDIQENTWSPIMSMTRRSNEHQVATVGKELFLYHGSISTLGVYNPAKNEWRLVERFWQKKRSSPLFITEGKFYLFSESGIDVFDVEQNSWINRHANSFATGQPDVSPQLCATDLLAVKDELLLTAIWRIHDRRTLQSLQCKGFDSEKKEMVWQKTNCSCGSFLLIKCSIQL